MNISSSYKILPNGNLCITLNDKSALDDIELDDYTDNTFLDLIEDCWCNGLSIVNPDDVGALTDSIILSDDSLDDDDEYPVDTTFWWYPNYQVKAPIEDLRENGCVIFSKAGGLS